VPEDGPATRTTTKMSRKPRKSLSRLFLTNVSKIPAVSG